jgi:hypothetical protein
MEVDFEERVRWRLSSAEKPSYYISVFNIRRGDRIFIVCRVSKRAQFLAGNLDDQVDALIAAVQRAGGVVVGVKTQIGNGANPEWLAAAAVLARRRGARLLAETTDRLIRHPDYHSTLRPKLQAGQAQLERMAECLDGAEVMTLVDPDAPPHDNMSQHRQRGQEQKGHCGGRSLKKEQTAGSRPGDGRILRKKWTRTVLSMHRAGAPYREIEAATKIPWKTCWNWVRFWS